MTSKLVAGFAVAAALALTVALSTPVVAGAHRADGGPTVVTARPGLDASVLATVNAVRRAHGLAPVVASAQLARVAAGHADSMGARGYFSHDSADGGVYWKRIERAYGSTGYWRWSVGENLLWRSPGVTPAQVVRMWLDSPPHRRVLLTPGWHEVGIAAVHVTNAPGVFHGDDVTIVAADFGARG